MSDAKIAYRRRTDSLGEPAMRELERRVVLSVIDRRWRDHLYEMDYLKDGIGLRAMAQRDPLVEYQREGFSLFQNMMGQIREESIGFLFNLEVEVTAAGDATAAVPAVAAKGLAAPGAPAERLSYSAPARGRRRRGAQSAWPDRAGGDGEGEAAAGHGVPRGQLGVRRTRHAGRPGGRASGSRRRRRCASGQPGPASRAGTEEERRPLTSPLIAAAWLRPTLLARTLPRPGLRRPRRRRTP